jgi:hypothetical protein
MAGPWEKYATTTPAQQAGPWAKYAARPEQIQPPQEDVIATTPDGGRVIRRQGGLAFTSPGYSTTDQDAIARIMEGATPASESVSSFDRQTLAQAPFTARAQELVQGTPLVGEFADEAVSLVSPRAAQGMRALSNAMERENPIESAALNITGGIAAAAPLAAVGAGGKVADFIGGAGSKIGAGLRTVAVGATAGGIEGAASGAGRDQENRVRGAATYGAIGAGAGAFLAPAAAALGVGAGALAKRIKRLDVQTIAEEFGLSKPAALWVKGTLMNDDIGAAAARLSQLGDDAMLADAGPATGALLDAASKAGGRGLAVAREAVEGRASTVAKRLPGKLDEILGASSQGIKTSAREIASSTSAARRAAYDRAFASPIDYAADAGRNIESVLGRIPPKTLQAAINEANEEMQSLGLRNMQIMAQIADDGSVSFQQMPNLRQLDELKKALSSQAAAAVDQFGRPTGQGNRYRRLAVELRDAAAEAVPSYRTALKLGGDKLQRDEALDLGRNLLFQRTSTEDVREFMAKGISQESREAIAQGLREAIDKTMGNVRRAISDPNVDAREAMKMVTEASSNWNMSKLRMVLGPQKAKELFTELDKQAAALSLRGVVARGSDSAIRLSLQGQGKALSTPGLLRRTIGNMGNPLEAAREVTQEIAGIDPRSMDETQRALLAEIAEALVNTRGESAKRALQAVNNAMQGQPIKDAEARLIGQVVGYSAFQGHQGTRQIQASR